MQIQTYDPSETCKSLPSFCGVTTARQSIAIKAKEQDSGNPPTFMFGENFKVCLLWCYFFLLTVGRGASAM